MSPEHWLTLAIALLVCTPVATLHTIRFIRSFPRMKDPSIPATQRIDAQNLVFGALVGVPLPVYAIVVTVWLVWQRLHG